MNNRWSKKLLSIFLIVYAISVLYFNLNNVLCDYYATMRKEGCYLHFECARSLIRMSLIIYIIALEVSCTISHFLLLSLIKDKYLAYSFSVANFAFVITGNIEPIIVMLILISYDIKSESISAIILTIASFKIYVCVHTLKFIRNYKENVFLYYVVCMGFDDYMVVLSCAINLLMLLRVSVFLAFVELKKQRI